MDQYIFESAYDSWRIHIPTYEANLRHQHHVIGGVPGMIAAVAGSGFHPLAWLAAAVYTGLSGFVVLHEHLKLNPILRFPSVFIDKLLNELSDDGVVTW